MDFKKITKAFFSLIFVSCMSFAIQAPVSKRSTVVIDPAGHSKDLGRLLVEGYERAETLKFANALKQKLESMYGDYINPVISRVPGEEVYPLQMASFSNRLQTDLFLRIHMFRQESEKPQIFLYHLLFSPVIDQTVAIVQSLSLISLYQAHVFGANTTKFYGKKIFDHLSQPSFGRYFDCHPLLGLPVKSLVGISAPAILLEFGICREDKWGCLVDPIAESLKFLIN